MAIVLTLHSFWILESRAAGQIRKSCQSLAISNLSKGAKEGKHRIEEKMRSVNSGKTLH